MTDPLTPDQALCQQMAETMHAIATSENHAIAWSRSPVYRHADIAFRAAVQAAYHVSPLVAQRVRDLLAEYGPHDSLRGTHGKQGVASYVQHARAWRTSY